MTDTVQSDNLNFDFITSTGSKWLARPFFRVICKVVSSNYTIYDDMKVQQFEHVSHLNFGSIYADEVQHTKELYTNLSLFRRDGRSRYKMFKIKIIFMSISSHNLLLIQII